MKHNKKRNTGLIYELLLRYISNSLIENDKKNAKEATNIISRRFNKKSELYKEFRLYNALAKGNITSAESGAAVLSEAKNAARRINTKKIEIEKSKLIKEINYNLNDSNFYHRRIPNYTDYGNIYLLIKEWQKNDSGNLKKILELEQKVISVLLNKKEDNALQEIKEIDSEKSNKLVYSIMTKKLNEKYKDIDSEQKEIIKNYAFYLNENKEKLVKFLSNKKKECILALESFQNENNNKYLSEKINPVKEKIINLNETKCDDEEIVKFLTLVKLKTQLLS